MRRFFSPLMLGVALVAAGCATEGSAATGAPIVDVEVLSQDVAPSTTTTTTTTTVAPTTTTVPPPTTTTTTTIPINPACSANGFGSDEIHPDAQGLATRINAAIEHPGFAGHDVSISVWVDGWGEVATHNPDLLLNPASNQKVITAIGANELLDLDARLTTEIELLGNDLVIRAGADPTLTFSRLMGAIDTALPRLGTSIDRVIIDVTEFPQIPEADGWLDWHMPQFVGPLSALMLENNRWTQDPTLLQDPDQINGQRIASFLGDRGVNVASVAVARLVSPAAGEQIATVQSEPIGSLIRSMLLSSDNQHADLLLMEAGRVALGEGSLAAGAAAVDAVLFDSCGSLDGTISDGSGLSRANFRTARSFVQSMAALHGTPEGELLRSQLPVGGVSGTLAGRFGGANAGLVQAKTGTILTGRSLGGWARMANGRDAIFSVIVNGADGATSGSVAAIDALVREIIVNPAGTPDSLAAAE